MFSKMISFRPNYTKLTGLLLLSICLTTGCSKRQSALCASPDHALEFGHGGGFTGIEYRYILLPNGRLYASGGKQKYIGNIPVRTVEQLFHQMVKISKTNHSVIAPSNTYQFMNLKNGENEHRWVWNSSNPSTLDAQIRIIHSILMKFSTKNNSTDFQ